MSVCIGHQTSSLSHGPLDNSTLTSNEVLEAKLAVVETQLEILQEAIRDSRMELDSQKEHNAFLERLIAALYGEGWTKLTIDKARGLQDKLRENEEYV